MLTPMVASGQPVERSFDEFLAAQGTFCLTDGLGGCLLLNPPLPNMLAWQDADDQHCAFVDYAGLANKYIADASGGAIALGTTVRGRVTESTESDGTAVLTISLSADNALMWVVEGCNLASGTVVFGSNVNEVLQGIGPAVGSVVLRTVVLMPSAGMPLPDLFQVLAHPSYLQGFLQITLTAHASSVEGAHASVIHKSVWDRGSPSYRGPILAEMIIVR